MKKLMDRVRQEIQRPKAISRQKSSSDLQNAPLSSLEEPAFISSSPILLSGEAGSAQAASARCQHVFALAQSITAKWEADPHVDLTSDMRELWSCFCDAGMYSSSQQPLTDLLKSLLEKSSSGENAAQQFIVSPWKDLPQFKLVVEEKLRQSLMENASWVTLNHLLARISLPPASMYDLRMACLWNLRDVLETSSVTATVDMLKILVLWLGGHIHWLQLQILRAHSKAYPDDALISLELGDLPAKVEEDLQPTIDRKRLNFWRRRLQVVHDAEASDASIKFYASSVLSLLEVGIAAVDEWKEDIPAA